MDLWFAYQEMGLEITNALNEDGQDNRSITSSAVVEEMYIYTPDAEENEFVLFD